VTLSHARLQRNLLGELFNRLRGSGCEAFSSDLKVRIPRGGNYFYPDIFVVCGEPLLADDRKDIVLNPRVIFEVLSPSTELYDRGLKFQQYRTIESLQDYVLVDQNTMRIEHFTRQTDNTWTLRDVQQQDEELKIDSIGVSIPLGRVYEVQS
jgi:Uma2 family endonuclease